MKVRINRKAFVNACAGLGYAMCLTSAVYVVTISAMSDLMAQDPSVITRVNGKQATKIANGLRFKPEWGTFMAITNDDVHSILDGASVLYRTTPPKKPGDCGTNGTGAWGTDRDGYLYVCAPTFVKADSGLPGTMWLRSREPMLKEW